RPHIEHMEVRLLRSVSNWIGISDWFMNEWLRISRATPQRTAVLYNTVDCDLFHPGTSARRTNLVLYCGTIRERKGAFALARAANIFLRELPDAELWYVGSNAEGGQQIVASELHPEIASRVRFQGAMPQAKIAALMQEATIFAMPSLLESFG